MKAHDSFLVACGHRITTEEKQFLIFCFVYDSGALSLALTLGERCRCQGGRQSFCAPQSFRQLDGENCHPPEVQRVDERPGHGAKDWHAPVQPKRCAWAVHVGESSGAPGDVDMSEGLDIGYFFLLDAAGIHH